MGAGNSISGDQLSWQISVVWDAARALLYTSESLHDFAQETTWKAKSFFGGVVR